jgi:hypothetical protein
MCLSTCRRCVVAGGAVRFVVFVPSSTYQLAAAFAVANAYPAYR